MHTPSPSLSFLKILWNFSIKLLSLHEIISIIMWSWFKFPLNTVKPGQALGQRVHQWIDYLKIESVSRCTRNEQWISGYYFQYLGRIFTAHYACRNTEMDLKSMTTNRFNFRKITLKFIGIFKSGGGGRFAWPGLTITSMTITLNSWTSCYYGQHHNKGKQQWLNTWLNIQTIHWKDSTPQWTYRDFFRSSQHNFITISDIKKHKG